MAAEFLGTYAAFEVNGTIVLLTHSQGQEVRAYLTAPHPLVNGKVTAIKAVREWHRISLRDSKELVEVIEREITS